MKPKTYIAALTLATLLALTACRRELYVYGDEFYSVVLNVDWRDYDDNDPDGMTVWFYNLDNLDIKPYRTTTANVRHQQLYLPNARYQGVVVSYSPEEYAHQQFTDMDDVHYARIEATPAAYQAPDLRTPGAAVSDDDDIRAKVHLYGPQAWTDAMTPRTDSEYVTANDSLRALAAALQLSTICNQPEDIGADTLDNRAIDSGTTYGDYIPWKERENYQTSITVQQLEALTHTLVEKMRVRVYIKEGLNYLYATQATITGMADGHFLPRHVNTENACLIAIDGWQTERTGPNEGWVSATVATFGIRPATRHANPVFHPSTAIGKSRYDGEECDIQGYYTDVCDSDDLRLNLVFVLRDQHTVMTYRYDVGHLLVSYDDQMVLRLELGPDFLNDDPIILPKVDAYGGADFGADVTPWVDVEPVDVSF